MKNKSKLTKLIVLSICTITLYFYLIDNKSIILGTIIMKSISVSDLNDSVIIGSKYILPSHVKGILQNGTEKEALVLWTPSKPDTSKSGTFYFVGKIKGYKGNVKLVLNVKKITSIADYKVAIYQGEDLSFPVVVKADIDDGTNREVNVNWNSIKFDSSKTGIFNIEGYVNGYDKKVNLKVLVSSKTDKERNITLEQKKIKRVPVLMYHYIEDYNDKDEYKELKISKEKFNNQLKYLKDNGYSTLTLNEIYDFIVNHKCIPEKSVALTFDDGYNDNYTNAFPIIKEYGYNATVFVVTNWIDKEGLPYISSEHLKEMDAAGMDIESHTLNHDHLRTLSYDKQLETLKGSKVYLESLLNKKVNFIGYPFGEEDNNTIKAVKAAGYTMGFLSDGKWADENQGIYTLARVYISSYFDINEFANRISNTDYN